MAKRTKRARAHLRRLKSKKIVVVDGTPHDHPLVAVARAEPEVRKRRFIMALARTLQHMNGEDLAEIEPVLQRVIGRVVVERIDEGLVP